MNCMHATRLLSQARERRLSWRVRLGLQVHLLMCDACTQFSRQLDLLRQAVRRLTHRVERDEKLNLSSTARDRIAAAVEVQKELLSRVWQNQDQNSTD